MKLIKYEQSVQLQIFDLLAIVIEELLIRLEDVLGIQMKLNLAVVDNFPQRPPLMFLIKY